MDGRAAMGYGRPTEEFGTPNFEVPGMSEKQKLIKEMLEMQKKFMKYEHEHGIDPQDYYVPSAGHELDGFRQKYRDLAMKVVELAHQEKGSHP